jgi:hypothetical protein
VVRPAGTVHLTLGGDVEDGAADGEPDRDGWVVGTGVGREEGTWDGSGL